MPRTERKFFKCSEHFPAETRESWIVRGRNIDAPSERWTVAYRTQTGFVVDIEQLTDRAA